jgi:hypothetical protein
MFEGRFVLFGTPNLAVQLLTKVWTRAETEDEVSGYASLKDIQPNSGNVPRNEGASIRLRPANLTSDRAALVQIFARQLTSVSDLSRFQWLYCDAPSGNARAWVACDEATGIIVGAASAFPRKVYVRGDEAMGLVLGDFCMDEKYRSLGPSLRLQRECLGAINEIPFKFLYDFPSERMMAVYKRLGFQQNGTLIRWAKPLRAERRLQRLFRSKRLAHGFGAVANAALRWRGWKGRFDACDLQLHYGPCGEEFTTLDTLVRKKPGVATAKTAEYLNWRYLEQPTVTHEILTARRSGTLIGYIVFRQTAENARIVDICSVEEPSVIARILSGAIAILHKRKVATVSLSAADAHPWSKLFERAGFCRREVSPIVVKVGPNASISLSDFQAIWYLMEGERDS